MKRKPLIYNFFYLTFLVVPFLVQSQPSISDEGFKVIKEAYTYDRNLPFDQKITETEVYSTHTRQKISFIGVREKVSAYLAVPNKGNGPFPVVLLIDGMGGSKERWWEEEKWPNGLETTEALIKKGFAVFALDAAMHGDRMDTSRIFPKPLQLRKENLMHTVRNLIQETVQDYMRGVDYLETRADIDSKRVGAYGLSMGGAVTFALTGLDKRIKTSVMGVAVVYGNAYSIVNAYNFTSRITNQPILMLMGTTDAYYTPQTATELFNSIKGSNNKLIIFEGGHKIPLTYVPVIAAWFVNALH